MKSEETKMPTTALRFQCRSTNPVNGAKCLRPAGHEGKCAGCLCSWYNTTPLKG